MKDDLRHRLTDSVETALGLADRLVVVDVIDGEEMTFSERFACPFHGVGLPSSSRASSPSTRPTVPARAARGSATSRRSTPT
jgi:excinuclease ABC subunit A